MCTIATPSRGTFGLRTKGRTYLELTSWLAFRIGGLNRPTSRRVPPLILTVHQAIRSRKTQFLSARCIRDLKRTVCSTRGISTPYVQLPDAFFAHILLTDWTKCYYRLGLLYDRSSTPSPEECEHGRHEKCPFHRCEYTFFHIDTERLFTTHQTALPPSLTTGKRVGDVQRDNELYVTCCPSSSSAVTN